jgi:hypothetical protein
LVLPRSLRLLTRSLDGKKTYMTYLQHHRRQRHSSDLKTERSAQAGRSVM